MFTDEYMFSHSMTGTQGREGGPSRDPMPVAAVNSIIRKYKLIKYLMYFVTDVFLGCRESEF